MKIPRVLRHRPSSTAWLAGIFVVSLVQLVIDVVAR